MSITKESAQTINTLFSFLNNLHSAVFWISTANFQKQILLSPSYEYVWGRSGDIIRETGCATWSESLVKDDLQRNFEGFIRRSDTPGANALLYRVHRPHGDMQYIKDTSYTLIDAEGRPSIIMGVAEAISSDLWHELYTQPVLTISKQSLLLDCIDILKDEYNLLPQVESTSTTAHHNKPNYPCIIYVDGKQIHLSPQQNACIYFLLKGFSAKQTANQLNLSARTIEFYIDILKNKFNCRSKLALLGVLKNAIIVKA